MSHVTCKAAKMFVFTALSAALMTGAASAVEQDMAVALGKTTGSGLRMREYPTTEADVVYKMEKGTTLAILDEAEDGWYHVTYNGKTGYVSGEYLNQLDGEVKTYARVNGEGVYVRAEPNEDSEVLNVIDNKAYVTVLGLENGYYKVKCRYGTEGYIRSDYMALTDNNGESSSSSSSNGSATGNSAVSIAMKYKGCRYVYGAAGPSRFDCSGLTMYVYGKLGISLPHSASAQWTGNYGSRVYKMSALQPGDLVFFRNPSIARGKACSHVGIYIGNNQILHASSSRTGVIVSNLNSGSYRKYFVGGKHF